MHKAVESGVAALQAGFRHIDTAQYYKTEADTKEAIEKAMIPRNEVYITSKRTFVLLILLNNCTYIYETVSFLDDDQPVPLDLVRELVKETTRKLGSIPDLFLIHNPFVAKPGELKQVWNILEDLKMKGKLKSIGVSNFRPQDLHVVLKNARYTPVVNQVRRKISSSPFRPNI